MFNPTRINHQNVVRAEFTGDRPLAALLCDDTPRASKFSDGCAEQRRLLGYADWRFGWLGCLDAPSLIVTGGCKVVFDEGEPCTVARTHHR